MLQRSLERALRVAAGGGHQRRIIPARAGQTLSISPVSMGRPDHPRACGANKYTSSAFSPVPGSSPRVRGKRVPGTRPPVFVRSIPAHAGQTVSPRIQTTCPSDHPRACGANIEHLERQQRKYRSSPRVRGKLFLPFFACAGIRIIPARAGQTARRCRAAPERPDHPRACGANGKAFHTEENLPGSSPRVRGKRRHWGGGVSSLRIIPARAGQTAVRGAWPIARPDHPRARGKPTQHPIGCVAKRIIPARAGQTLG